MDVVRGRCGEFKITVGGDVVIDGGAAAFLGVMPSRAKIVAAVKPQLQPKLKA